MKISEIIVEAINPEILDPDVNKSIEVTTSKGLPITLKLMSNGEFTRVEAWYQGRRVGTVDFDPDNNYLVARDLIVPSFQRQGIATVMYNWIKQMGNDIKPSPSQTPDGQKFWQGKKDW